MSRRMVRNWRRISCASRSHTSSRRRRTLCSRSGWPGAIRRGPSPAPPCLPPTSRRLILMRHAESEAAGRVRDHDREITSQGAEEARQVGPPPPPCRAKLDWMHPLDCKPWLPWRRHQEPAHQRPGICECKSWRVPSAKPRVWLPSSHTRTAPQPPLRPCHHLMRRWRGSWARQAGCRRSSCAATRSARDKRWM